MGRTLAFAAAAAAPLLAATPALGAACEDLTGQQLAGGQVTSALAAPAGDLTVEGYGAPRVMENMPGFCRATLMLTPTDSSEIHVTLLLPEPGAWNGNYLAIGNGGFAGSIGEPALLAQLAAGYAVSQTDTGHQGGGDGGFGMDREVLVDFAHRAVHEMAVASKTLIAAYYGAPPDHAYFNGCSTGGRQAITAASRYPTDFDGIVAGAPAVSGARLHAAQTWTGRVAHETPGGPLPDHALPLLHDAALAACDAHDGVADGVIENPLACDFAVAEAGLICAPDQPAETCFTPAQADIAQAIYDGPAADGASLFPGLAPGSEPGWAQMLGPEPLFVAADFYRYFVYGDPDWSPEGFAPARAIAGAAEIEPVIGGAEDDLTEFVRAGGRLIVYHGWADPGISPYNSVDWTESALANSGPDAVDHIRLFMVPGMGHCAGGEGPSSFDALDALDAWVADGAAPERIIASRVRAGETDRTRPLCPWPQTAVWTGEGDTDSAENFRCE